MVCMVIAYNLADQTTWEGLGPEVAEFQTFSFSRDHIRQIQGFHINTAMNSQIVEDFQYNFSICVHLFLVIVNLGCTDLGLGIFTI